MKRKDQAAGPPVNRAWVEVEGRPRLVDYGGLRVSRTPLRVVAGQAGYRPFVLLLASLFIFSMLFVPIPGSLTGLLERVDPPGYDILEPGTHTIVDSVNAHEHSGAAAAFRQGSAEVPAGLDSTDQVARRALIMVSILVVAAVLWGTEALPIGGTVILVAVLMLGLGILPPEEVPQAFVNEAVFFILGILAVAVGVSKTGLDKRIGLMLLSFIGSTEAFAFVFFPVFAVASAFLSAHALVALLVPVLMGVYKATCKANGVKQDRMLAIFLLLGLTFAANAGGPGSPAAGARNAIMMGYLADAGFPIGFGEWLKYGLPLVPVLALTVGAYMYVRTKPGLVVESVNPSEVVRREVADLPPFGGREAVMAVVLSALILAWVLLYDTLGLGGATLTAVSAMFLFRIIGWEDLQGGVAFDVVGLYGAASAIAVGLTFTGGGLWLANETIDLLPGFLSHGNGLVLGVSIMTGTLTNFMSDGATVGALGPLALPMAELGDVSVWKVGLMVSFASSFANVLLVGTPNNAIAFVMSKDPETGERLLSVFDFVKYGLPLTVLLMVVMWGWALFGYWTFLPWP